VLRRIEHRVVQRLEIDSTLHFSATSSVFGTASGTSVKRAFISSARAQVELLRHVARAHALGIAQHGLRADADEAIVGVRMFLLDVMHVVRRHAFQPELLRPLDEVFVDLGLLGDAVVLEFEIEILRAERLLEPIHRVARLVELILHDRLRNLAGETAGQRDQPSLHCVEDFFVDARLVVITLQMRGGVSLTRFL
jgi:hypothetical protein